MYNHKEVEKKWQKYWEDNKIFEVTNNSDKPKFYLLVEFPYPSGVGLHVGHARVYTATDAQARFKRANGYNVMFPMGWDAFGAPAEQYAIKNHIHPKEAVNKNIKVFKGQMQSLGLAVDWSREFSTTDPDYYKWTQWQFLQFYKHNMAYKTKKNINWCPVCKTGLSNEDSSGGVCERCGSKVVQKEKEQWMLRMSDYAEELLNGLEDTNFNDRTKNAQINWIGKSIGAEVDFKLQGLDDKFTVFTTRCDTLFGVTFMVIAPEHPLIDKYASKIKNIDEVKKYQELSKEKTEFERTELVKEKTGVCLDGLLAINPVNNKEIPIYISDYVMMNYGTGAIMAVPSHDQRDYEFATKFNIPIIQVLEEITGSSHKSETKKNSIVAVIYDEKEDKYLTINWGNAGGRLFVGGTRKPNESALDCAIREIKEETGYQNFELIKELPRINHHYYAYNKDKYFNIDSTGFLFKLIDNTKSSQQLDEDEIFNVEWVNKNTIIKEVVDELHKKTFEYSINDGAMAGDGIHINSEFLDGLNKEDAINKMLEYLEKEKIGKKKINYKLQDWIFSRQRFWGEPIPMIHCDKCGWVPMNEKDLPLLLPDVAEYEPTDNGESPLAKIKDWVNTTCPKCHGKALRETDTMPNWAGSSWYWLRYMDPQNDKEFVSKDALNYWGKVDLYDGGMEHATRHLLYARFWNQFLYNIGLIPNSEPFNKRISHGMILASNGEKMSKSKGNVVNPNDMIREYGADALRCYELFIGDYSKDAAWSENGLRGCYKFLNRVWNLKDKLNNNKGYSSQLEISIHKTIKKVTEDLDSLNYNTAVSALMILLNDMEKLNDISKDEYRILLQLLNPIAPHITEELNEICDLGDKFTDSTWPNYDINKTVSNIIEIGVQVNGKLRGTIKIEKDMDKEKVETLAKEEDNVKKNIKDKEIVKVIIVPNRIVNIVVK